MPSSSSVVVVGGPRGEFGEEGQDRLLVKARGGRRGRWRKKEEGAEEGDGEREGPVVLGTRSWWRPTGSEGSKKGSRGPLGASRGRPGASEGGLGYITKASNYIAPGGALGALFGPSWGPREPQGPRRAPRPKVEGPDGGQGSILVPAPPPQWPPSSAAASPPPAGAHGEDVRRRGARNARPPAARARPPLSGSGGHRLRASGRRRSR